MERRHRLRDDQWDMIKDALPGKQGDPGRIGDDNQRFVEAVMWIARTGAPWRDLPPEYGKWSGVHKRFVRWSKNGVWQMIFNRPKPNIHATRYQVASSRSLGVRGMASTSKISACYIYLGVSVPVNDAHHRILAELQFFGDVSI